MKVYRLNFNMKKISDNTIVTIEKSSELRITDKTVISDILKFEKDAQGILSEVKKCYKNTIPFDVELTVAIYEKNFNILNSKSFDRWTFSGVQNTEDGLYLTPDARYTNENHDLWIDYKEGFLKGIENV